jgi:hypothetical protein
MLQAVSVSESHRGLDPGWTARVLATRRTARTLAPAPRCLGLLALLRRCDLAFQVDKRSRVGSRDQGRGFKPGYGPSSSFLRLHEGLARG